MFNKSEGGICKLSNKVEIATASVLVAKWEIICFSNSDKRENCWCNNSLISASKNRESYWNNSEILPLNKSLIVVPIIFSQVGLPW